MYSCRKDIYKEIAMAEDEERQVWRIIFLFSLNNLDENAIGLISYVVIQYDQP